MKELSAARIHYSGPSSHKVDLLILGDGYTAAECPTFVEQAQRLSDALFSAYFERGEDVGDVEVLLDAAPAIAGAAAHRLVVSGIREWETDAVAEAFLAR